MPLLRIGHQQSRKSKVLVLFIFITLAMLQTLMESMPAGSTNMWQELTHDEQLGLLRQHSLNPADDNNDNNFDDDDYEEEYNERSMGSSDAEKLAFLRRYLVDDNMVGLPELASLSQSLDDKQYGNTTELVSGKDVKFSKVPVDRLFNVRQTSTSSDISPAAHETQLAYTYGVAQNATVSHEKTLTSSKTDGSATNVASNVHVVRTTENAIKTAGGATASSDQIEKQKVDTIVGGEQLPLSNEMRFPAASLPANGNKELKSNTIRVFRDEQTQIIPQIDFIPETKPLKGSDDDHSHSLAVAAADVGHYADQTLRRLSVLHLMRPIDDEEIRCFPNRIISGVRQSTGFRVTDNHQRKYQSANKGKTKMWKGYYGNVYFEPIMIEQVALKRSTSGRCDGRPVATEQDGGQMLYDLAALGDSSSAEALFRLSERFYQQLPDSLRSSPPWIWKTVGNCQRKTSINTPPTSAANRRVKIPPTSSAAVASTLTPRLVPSTALAGSSVRKQTSTQRDRFKSATAMRSHTATAAISGRQLEGISNTACGTTTLVDSFPNCRPTPPETSPDQRRREQPFDKKRIRRGRSLSIGGIVDSPRHSVLTVGGGRKGSVDDNRHSLETSQTIAAATASCLVTANPPYFRRTAPSR